MIGWLISVLLVTIFSIGSVIPGSVDRTLTRSLQTQLGTTASGNVHVEADPLLQLPFGVVPSLTATLLGYKVQGLPIHQVQLRLTELHLEPGSLYFRHVPVLLQPAHAELELVVDTGELQGLLDRMEANGTFSNLSAQIPLVGRSSFALQGLTLHFGDRRLYLAGALAIADTGAHIPFEASVEPVLEAGRRVVLQSPRLSLNGKALPSFLIAPQIARLNPVFDLDHVNLPPGRWELAHLDLDPSGVRAGVHGDLTALPAAKP